MTPQAGWYPDPVDPEHYIRYWDGTTWTGEPRRMSPPHAPGERLQDVGNRIAKTGVSITLVVLSVFFLLALFILFL
jgi:hypothetical protein